MKGLWIWAIVSTIIFIPAILFAPAKDGKFQLELLHMIWFVLAGASTMGAWISLYQEHWLIGLQSRWAKELIDIDEFHCETRQIELYKKKEDWTEEELADWTTAFEQTDAHEEQGGLDFLKNEPDLYTDKDGEEIK